LQKRNRVRRFMANWNSEGEASGSLLGGLLWFLLIFGALMIGYFIGRNALPHPDAATADTKKVEKQDKDKNPDEAGKPAENAK
jgi:hypothetical protein